MIVLVRFTIRAADAARFLARVRRQASDSLALEEGCGTFDVAVLPGDARQVLLYEIYDDAAAFDRHLASDHYQAFDAEVAPWVEAKRIERWEGPLA